jgi:hypothetical protein
MLSIKLVNKSLKKNNIDVFSKLKKLGINIRRDFLQEYQYGNKTGKLYGKHRASAPGETPAKITGFLGANLKNKQSQNILDIIDTSGYGEYLEFGTKRIKPRQGVKQAIDKNLGAFKNELSRTN